MREIRLAARWTAAGVVVLAGVAALMVGAIVAVGWWTYGRHVANIEVAAIARLQPAPNSFVLLGAGEGCPDLFPVKVGIRNDGSRTLLRATLKIEATLPGRSTDILDHAKVVSDRIIKPGQTFEECWGFRRLPEFAGKGENAVYSAKIESAAFE